MRYLASKTAIPAKMPHLIPRPRIARRLAGRACELILLAAPAGYGKSVLALQLLEQIAPPRRVWLDLDARDDDPRRFAGYFIEALAHAVPALRQTRIQEEVAAGRLPISQAAEDLCFFLQESQRSAAWMVVDNWEQVDANAEIGTFVTTLAVNAKGRLRLIIASRVVPSFNIRRFQEKGIATLIDRKELAFTFFEFRDAAIRRLGARVSEEELEEIWRLTEGWCVHLGLVLEVLGRGGLRRRAPGRPDANDLESLLGYVEEELIPGIPSDLLDLLVRCAPLEVLTPAACVAIIEDEEQVKRGLGALARSSIPSFPLASQGAVRLHPLMREAMARLLRARRTSEEVDALYHRAAAFQIEQGLVLEGIRTLLDSGDHGAALDAIHAHWFRIVELGAQGRAQAWLESLPERWRAEAKYVTVMTNVISLSGDNGRLVRFLQDKVTPESFPGDDAALANAWMHYYWALLHESEAPRPETVTESWEAIARSRGPFAPIVLAGVENIQGYADLLQLEFARAAEHYRRSLTLQGAASFDYAVTTRNNIALCDYMSGDADRALEEFRGCEADCVRRSAPSMLPMVLINIAEVSHATGAFDAASDAIERCFDVMRTHGMQHPFIDMTAAKIRGLSAWSAGRKDEAWSFFDAAWDAAQRCGAGDTMGLTILLDYLAGLDGRPQAGGRDRTPPPRGRPSENRLAYAAAEAWRAMEDGDGRSSGSLLTELLAIAEGARCRPWMITSRLLSARHADMEGSAVACRRHLDEGLRLLAEIGWKAYPMANPKLTAFIHARSVRWDLQPEIADRLVGASNVIERAAAFENELRAAANVPQEATRLLEAAARARIRGLGVTATRFLKSRNPELAEAARGYLAAVRDQELPPLSIRMLGGFGVTAGGASVTFARKKSRVLLQMLLIEHPAPVHEEQILETLWPHAEPARGRAALQSAVKDLRLALDPHHEPRGRSYVDYGDGHYGLHLPSGSVCDARIFEDAARRALARTPGKEPPGDADRVALESVLAQFGGEVLPEQRLESFVQEFRERLHRRFLDAALALARSCNASGRHADAVRHLERGLAIDPLWAEGIQELMLARSKGGELCRALRLYREYERTLRRELRLAPDPEMRRSFESLLAVEVP